MSPGGREGGEGRKKEVWAAGQWSVCERGAPRGVGRVWPALPAAFPAAGSQREAFTSQRMLAPLTKARRGGRGAVRAGGA